MAWPRLWPSRDRNELERLRQSEARYRLLAESAGDLMIQYDTNGVIQYASPSAAAFGHRPEDLLGRRMQDLGHPDEADLRLAQHRALEAGEPLRTGPENEQRFRRGDGAWIWIQGHPTALRSDDGRVTGAVTIIRDVSERRSLEDELRRREAAAQAAVAAKAEFLANMSHEIRTPLTAVVGFSSLLAKMADLPEKARTYAARIGDSGDALAAIVNNVLDFSRVEAGQVQLKADTFDLRVLIEDALGVVRDQARIKGVSLDVRIAHGAPPRLVADSGRLRQVLLNLLTNAVKFTREGCVTVEADYEAADQRLRLAVHDTGIGIAPELSDRLFQRFSQIEGSNTRRFGGVGLGLAISKGLVELMGGGIALESAEGKGSTFRFDIRAPAAADTCGEAGEATPVLAPIRLLLVDDAQPNRELIRALLGPFDVQVTEAADGIAAVAAARREPFDVVLMDLQMPGMDGMAAAREIRRAGAPNRGTPILAVSASVLPTDVEACRSAGMNDHIAKPIDAHELVGKIAQWTTFGAPRVA